MKDLVENRRLVRVVDKLKLVALIARENGLAYTFSLYAYYFSSWAAEKSFARMHRLRLERGLPGLNSLTANREIWDKWDWSGGGEEWTLSEAWKASLVKNILEKHIPSGSVILEIGPGAGRWTEYLLPRAAVYTGVDISASCIEICQKRFAGWPQARFVINSGSDLEAVESESVDRLWSFDTFVHINTPEVRAYTSEFWRVMKPGGLGIIHHGDKSGEYGGWRSNLSGRTFREILEENSLQVVDQFSEWQDEEVGQVFPAGYYHDLITVFQKQNTPGPLDSVGRPL